MIELLLSKYIKPSQNSSQILSFNSKMRILFFSFIIQIFLSAEIYAQPQSARAFGMGNAFTAISNDCSAMFFNPAGLGAIKQIETSALFGRYFYADSNPQTELHIAGVLPLQKYQEKWSYGGTVGGFIQHAGRKDETSLTNLGASWGISLKDLSVKVPYLPQYGILNNFYVGIQPQVKRISRPSSTNIGVGLDFGILYFFNDGLSIYEKGRSVGIAVQNINSPSVSVPVLFRAGAAWEAPYATFALDMTAQEESVKFLPGVEVPFLRKLIKLRAGTGISESSARQISLGMGIILPPIQMDVAYGCPWGNPLKTDDRILFSFTYRFEAPMLSQYFYQERLEKADEIENKVLNLESKKTTLQSQIQEHKNIYRTVANDLERAIAERARLNEESKNLSEKISEKADKIKKSEAEIEKLEEEKKNAEENLKKAKKEEEISPVYPPHSGHSKKHKVVKGDTLRSLAEKYYGNANLWKLIFDANTDKMIRGTPKTGEEIVIP